MFGVDFDMSQFIRLGYLSTGLDKQSFFGVYNCKYFLTLQFSICFGCSKELSH